MARSFPPDVLVLDNDALVHARFGRGTKNPRITQARSYRLGANTFRAAVVSPELANEGALVEVLRRLKNDTGRWEKVSLLLPDAWFRINILEVPSLPERPAEAMEVVRWSLKRTLPIPPEQLRVAYQVLGRTAMHVKVLVFSAVEATLAAIERVFASQGIEIVLVEPVGINIWNAITVREAETPATRLFVYVADNDFTTAVFRGAQPIFIRSRNLSGDRTFVQEIRLSANYLRESLTGEKFAQCYIAGNQIGGDVQDTLASEFNTQVLPVALRDYVEDVPMGVSGLDAELTAAAGVFTG